MQAFWEALQFFSCPNILTMQVFIFSWEGFNDFAYEKNVLSIKKNLTSFIWLWSFSVHF
jgi:hypothetical protein